MASRAEILRQAEGLSPEDRAYIVDALLNSLECPDSEIERAWASVARSRLQEIRNGKVVCVPADEVFAKLGIHEG